MKKLLLAALAALTLSSGVMVIAAVPAEAAESPVITSPGPDQQVPSGISQVTIDVSAATDGTYSVNVDCWDTDQYRNDILLLVDSTTPNSVVVSFDPVAGPASDCLAQVSPWSGDATGYHSVNFSIAAPLPPAVAMSNTSVGPNDFYPLVRDGYRDTTTAHYTLNRSATVTALVTNSKGRTVRKSTFTHNKGRRGWTWNGKRNDGSKAPAGAYRLRITAKADGVTRTFSERVYVKTALVTRSAAKRKEGDEARFATSGSCYASKDTYYEIGELDCWGGNYAMATYGFGIPASAFDISWRMPGETGGADICCSGSITKSGTRTSRTSFRLRTKVTGLRAYDIWYARVSYKFKKRI